MKRLIFVVLFIVLLAGCVYDSFCVSVYDDQGRLVYINICMKGTIQDNWETVGVIVGGVVVVVGLTMGIIVLSK